MADAMYVGVDLGGANIKAGVVDESGAALSRISIPTEVDGGPEHVVERIAKSAAMAIEAGGVERNGVAAIGLGSPGPLDHAKGFIWKTPNLCFENYPIRDRVSKASGFRVVLENDANAAAWGEFWSGAGRGADSMVLFTLGTGIGGGVIADGRLLRGARDAGGELGHCIIRPGGAECACGQRGCVEAYASAMYTARRAQKGVASGEPSSLKHVLDQQGKIECADVAWAAADGDPFALGVWSESCEALALACLNAAHFIDPDLIVFSGGMAEAGSLLLDSVRGHLKSLYWSVEVEHPPLALASLGGDAGFIGAAGLAKFELQEEIAE
jgi:glucokinase